MKKYVYLLLLCTIQLYAQPSTIQWKKCFGGSNFDPASFIQQTSDGGYIAIGSSFSTDGDVSGNHGQGDAWIVKLSATGTIEWRKAFGGSQGDVANYIQQTTDGGYIIAGTTSSFDGSITNPNPLGIGECWIIKLDASGSILWQKTYGGTQNEQALCIKEISTGYVFCAISKSSNFDATLNHGLYDYWIVKIDFVGNIVWQKSFGGTGDDYPYSIETTVDGGYVIAGYSNSTDGDAIGNHGNNDAWIIKLDTAGNLLWQKTFGGTDDDRMNCIKTATDGGYILTGYTASNNGDASGNNGLRDVWILKINDSGNLLWQKCLGGTNQDFGSTITPTQDGGYFITGSSASSNGDLTQNHAGSNDVWTVKTNQNGTILWQKSMGGNNTDFGIAGHQTTDGGYIIIGQSISTDGDVVSNHGQFDYWVIKLNPENLNTQNQDFTNIIVYPNPAKDKLYIANVPHFSSLKITTVLGVVVINQTNSDGNVMVNLEELPQGFYIVQIMNEGKIIATKKILVTK